ncbi:hypothetical protein [Streptantibioticus silvisoli]|uniref:Secreted protein n=1 Tax=Streptantibioticus silvisoli TaxID=2705255 RepID=A0ABT6W4Y7_9ACTN|nr:hypothetical protein [Streptantibioticus silvisoli]MDI5965819.1 hypothetical protein [Streptantibioticus silvisoli]
MTPHLSEPQMFGAAVVVYALVSAVVLRGGASGRWLGRLFRRAVCCWLAYGRTRAAAMHRPPRHRARHPRMAVLAAHLTHTRHIPGGTR